MPWVKENSPTLLLWIYAILVPLIMNMAPLHSETIHMLWSWGLPLVLVAWVINDSRKRHISLCFDYDTFMFFAWPFLLPLYLFRTRGPRAFIPIAWFLLISLIFVLETFLLSAF
jgi:hypothetical protein